MTLVKIDVEDDRRGTVCRLSICMDKARLKSWKVDGLMVKGSRKNDLEDRCASFVHSQRRNDIYARSLLNTVLHESTSNMTRI